MPTAFDDFSGTSGTELSAYNPAWTRHNSYADILVISNAERVRSIGSGAGDRLYYHSYVPQSSKYSISLQITRINTANARMGVAARISDTLPTAIIACWDQGSVLWRLFDRINGVDTLIGTSTSLEPTTPRILELRVDANQVQLWVDSDLLISGTTSVSGTDRVGLYSQRAMSNTGGHHGDDWTVEEVFDSQLAITEVADICDATCTFAAAGGVTATASVQENQDTIASAAVYICMATGSVSENQDALSAAANFVTVGALNVVASQSYIAGDGAWATQGEGSITSSSHIIAAAARPRLGWVVDAANPFASTPNVIGATPTQSRIDTNEKITSTDKYIYRRDE